MASIDLKQRLIENGDCVTITLDSLIPPANGPESRLMSAMRYSALGAGKMLRPFMLIEAGRLFDVDERCLYRAAAALECVHCYSLIHDDLPAMDNDDLRRGQPTVHKAYDEATAILAGDALLTLAFEILSDEQTHIDANIRIKLVNLLAQAAGAKGMVGGQMIDMVAHELGDDISAVTRMQRLKTGLLFQFAMEAGGILGRASNDAMHALTGFAHDVGLAFQITDDILDVTGTREELGKSVNKDQSLGKATFVSLLGLKAAINQVEFLCNQAKSHLKMFGERAEYLNALVDFIAKRKS